MKLLWSSRSPFARKAMVAAHESGVADHIVTERVVVTASKSNPDVMAVNPLNKIPTLVLDDGTTLYGSSVICEYLDSLHDGPKLFPADHAARWPALRRQALGDGLMELGILRLGEQYRPAAMQSESQLAVYRLKIGSGLDRIEAEGLAPPGGADNWRDGRPKLSAWYAEFARRPAMRATEHVDVQ